jgi:hypothetical protein
MADLGNVAVNCGTENSMGYRLVVSPKIYVQSAPGDTNILDIDTTGSISGVVKITGVPTQYVRVGLFHRISMNLIANAITNNTGVYTFTGLDKTDLNNFFVTILDPQVNPTYNYTLTRDHLTPG